VAAMLLAGCVGHSGADLLNRSEHIARIGQPPRSPLHRPPRSGSPFPARLIWRPPSALVPGRDDSSLGVAHHPEQPRGAYRLGRDRVDLERLTPNEQLFRECRSRLSRGIRPARLDYLVRRGDGLRVAGGNSRYVGSGFSIRVRKKRGARRRPLKPRCVALPWLALPRGAVPCVALVCVAMICVVAAVS